MEQEHERAAGAWQAEWGTLAELLELTGSAAAWGRELLERLEVDADRMRENLARQRRVAAAAAGRRAHGQRRADRPGAGRPPGANDMSGLLLNHRLRGPEGAPPLVLGGSLGTNLAMWEPQLAARRHAAG